MSAPPAPTHMSLLRPARLLVAALVPMAAFLVAAPLTIEGDTAASMTPEQVADRAMAWGLVAVLWVLPAAMAAAAFWLMSRTVGARGAVPLLVPLGVILLAGHVVVQLAVIRSESTTLGDDRLYASGIVLSLLGWWTVDVAGVLTCRALARAGNPGGRRV